MSSTCTRWHAAESGGGQEKPPGAHSAPGGLLSGGARYLEARLRTASCRFRGPGVAVELREWELGEPPGGPGARGLGGQRRESPVSAQVDPAMAALEGERVAPVVEQLVQQRCLGHGAGIGRELSGLDPDRVEVRDGRGESRRPTLADVRLRADQYQLLVPNDRNRVDVALVDHILQLRRQALRRLGIR